MWLELMHIIYASAEMGIFNQQWFWGNCSGNY